MSGLKYKKKKKIQTTVVLFMLLFHRLKIIRWLMVSPGEYFLLWENVGQQLANNYPMLAQLFCSTCIFLFLMNCLLQ